jgi:hypothetical protein
VRAARRAVAANPDDARAWLVLGEAYNTLAFNTREGARSRGLLIAPMIRQSQIAACLQRALKLRPPLDEQLRAHLLLFSLYQDQRFFEPWARHFREFLRCSRELGAAPGQEKEYNKQLEQWEKDAKALEREVKKLQDQYEVQAANKPVLLKVNIAMQYGLPDTALNVLLKADPKELYNRPGSAQMAGATLMINLLLTLGRVEEVHEIFSGVTPEKEGAFGLNPVPGGVSAIGWAKVQAAAADGDYEAADQHLAALIGDGRAGPGRRPPAARSVAGGHRKHRPGVPARAGLRPVRPDHRTQLRPTGTARTANEPARRPRLAGAGGGPGG